MRGACHVYLDECFQVIHAFLQPQLLSAQLCFFSLFLSLNRSFHQTPWQPRNNRNTFFFPLKKMVRPFLELEFYELLRASSLIPISPSSLSPILLPREHKYFRIPNMTTQNLLDQRVPSQGQLQRGARCQALQDLHLKHHFVHSTSGSLVRCNDVNAFSGAG